MNEEGCSDFILRDLPREFEVVHWHNDMPGLTAEASILTLSEGYPRQIVRYSEKAYGFQCHQEPSLEDIKGMVGHCKNDLNPGPYVQSKEELLSADFDSINKTMYCILDSLLFHQKVSV